MDFERKSQGTSRLPDGQEPGQPHPDWTRNVDYFNQALKLPAVQKALKNNNCGITYEGVNKRSDGSFEVLTCAMLDWEVLNTKYCHPISFHQRFTDFCKEIEKVFHLKPYDLMESRESRY